MSSEVGAVKD